jgi:hypothetical protein
MVSNTHDGASHSVSICQFTQGQRKQAGTDPRWGDLSRRINRGLFARCFRKDTHKELGIFHGEAEANQNDWCEVPISLWHVNSSNLGDSALINEHM